MLNSLDKIMCYRVLGCKTSRGDLNVQDFS